MRTNKNRLGKLQEELDTVRGERNQAQNQCLLFRLKIEEYEKKDSLSMREFSLSRDKLIQINNELHTEFEGLTRKVKVLELKLKENTIPISTLSSNNVQLKILNKHLRSREKSLWNQGEITNGVNAGLRNELSELKEDHEKVSQDFDERLHEIKSLKDELNKWKNIASGKQKLTDQLNADFEKCLQNLNFEIKELRIQLDKKQDDRLNKIHQSREHKEYKLKYQSLDSNYHKIVQSLQKSERIREQLTEERNATQETMNHMAEEQKEQSRVIKKLKTKCQMIESGKEDTETIAQFRSKIRALVEKNEVLDINNTGLKNRIELIARDRDYYKSQIKNLFKQVKEYQELKKVPKDLRID